MILELCSVLEAEHVENISTWLYFVSSQYLSIKFPNHMHAHKAALYYDEQSNYYKNMKNGKPTLGKLN